MYAHLTWFKWRESLAIQRLLGDHSVTHAAHFCPLLLPPLCHHLAIYGLVFHPNWWPVDCQEAYNQTAGIGRNSNSELARNCWTLVAWRKGERVREAYLTAAACSLQSGLWGLSYEQFRMYMHAALPERLGLHFGRGWDYAYMASCKSPPNVCLLGM